MVLEICKFIYKSLLSYQPPYNFMVLHKNQFKGLLNSLKLYRPYKKDPLSINRKIRLVLKTWLNL